VKLLALVLATVVIVLIPLAHGSPIDPSTPGFWDGGDFDDVILFLTSHLHFLAVDALPILSSSEPVAQCVVEHVVGAVQGGSYEPGSPRAPPAA
jgi:hypothetical protein